MATTTSGRGRHELAPTSPCGDSRPARRRRSAPPASSIISGTQWPPTYGGSSHSRASDPRARRSRDGIAHAVEPRLQLAAQLLAALRHAGASRQPRHVVQHLAEGAPGPARYARAARQPRGHLADVVVGDGADRAERLGDDQVRRELRQRGLVQLVEGVAPRR